MSLRKDRLAVQILATIFILSGTVACSKQTVSQNVSTTFKCVEQTDGWLTFAQRGNATSSTPIFSWQSQEFGSKWTPKKRCHHVSEKLTKIVAENGSRLKGLDLTYGSVSNETVICIINANQTDCDRENTLFTLNQKNAQNPSLVIAKITNFAEGKGSDNTIQESGGATQIVSLEALVNSSFTQNQGEW